MHQRAAHGTERLAAFVRTKPTSVQAFQAEFCVPFVYPPLSTVNVNVNVPEKPDYDSECLWVG